MSKKVLVYSGAIIGMIMFFACGENQSIRQRRSPAESAEYLKDKLDLNDSQSEQVQQILEDQRDKMQKLRDRFSGDRREMRETMRELRDDTDRQIEELLTDDQKMKYEEFKEERRQNMRERFRDRQE